MRGLSIFTGKGEYDFGGDGGVIIFVLTQVIMGSLIANRES